MRLLHAKSGSALLVLAFALAPVLCCCPVKQAVAAMTPQPTSHDCCPTSNAPVAPNSPSHDDCDCGGRLTLAEPNGDVMWTAPSDTHLLPVPAFNPIAVHFLADDCRPHHARATDWQPPPIPDSLFARHCLLTT